MRRAFIASALLAGACFSKKFASILTLASLDNLGAEIAAWVFGGLWVAYMVAGLYFEAAQKRGRN